MSSYLNKEDLSSEVLEELDSDQEAESDDILSNTSSSSLKSCEVEQFGGTVSSVREKDGINSPKSNAK